MLLGVAFIGYSWWTSLVDLARADSVRHPPKWAWAAVVLLVMPLLGTVGVLRPWMPSDLVGALPELVAGGSAGDYVRAAGVAVLATVGALWGAVRLAGRHEL